MFDVFYVLNWHQQRGQYCLSFHGKNKRYITQNRFWNYGQGIPGNSLCRSANWRKSVCVSSQAVVECMKKCVCLYSYSYQPPKPKLPWASIFDCTTYRQACMQNNPISPLKVTKGSIAENCLHVNVIIPDMCTERNPCAVLHVIHGGSWYYDSPVMFDPKTLLENFASRGLIIVMAGYRLGTFGFWHVPDDQLTTGNYAIYGNIALTCIIGIDYGVNCRYG